MLILQTWKILEDIKRIVCNPKEGKWLKAQKWEINILSHLVSKIKNICIEQAELKDKLKIEGNIFKDNTKIKFPSHEIIVTKRKAKITTKEI